MKQKVAVIFGGLTQEHDVSILTGISVLEAIDTTKYDPFPVYISLDNEWFVGDALRKRGDYMFTPTTKKKLIQLHPMVTVGEDGRPCFTLKKGKLFGNKIIAFDVAFLSMHGTNGEDGALQGLFEMAQVPYTGASVMASSIAMNKHATKTYLKSYGIPVLPHVLLDRPISGTAPSDAQLQDLLKEYEFPMIVKPNNLGSSVGVSKVKTVAEAAVAIAQVFKMDSQAIIEPFVQNLVEYNIAVADALGDVRTSAIEEPKNEAETFDFQTKYLSGGASSKISGQVNMGLISATRDIHPKSLSDDKAKEIKTYAKQAFTALGLSGSPRLDFLMNGKTQEVWLNEINPMPGSFASFLWEAATPKVPFTELLSALIQEGLENFELRRRNMDPATGNSVIFPRKN